LSQEALYTKWSTLLKKQFGERVQKVSLDAGSGCPHKDSSGRGGCIFCDSRGGGSGASLENITLEQQIDKGISVAAKRYKAKKIILYFQSYSCTNIPLSSLVKLVEGSISYATRKAEVVGVSMGTRPDLVPDDFLFYLEELSERGLQVWLELGVQTTDEEGLLWLNRGHGIAEVKDALSRISGRNILTCAHLISGIKNEAPDQLKRSSKWLVEMSVDALKFHPLYVLKGTLLEKLYRKGEYIPLSMEDYAENVARALAVIPTSLVIQRLSADARSPWLVAPQWITVKEKVIDEIDRQLRTIKGLS